MSIVDNGGVRVQKKGMGSLEGRRPYRLAPSLLSADFARLGEEVSRAEEAGADWLHFDVMDGHYVPNLTIGPQVCRALRSYVQLPIDVHLMASPVDRLIADFAEAGANHLTVHPEAVGHLHRTLTFIRELGCRAGVAFNPATPLHCLDDVMGEVDLILIMAVNPGFGGQAFLPLALRKIERARERIDRHLAEGGQPVALAVDGGIKLSNVAQVARAGVDTFVMGSAFFGQDRVYADVVQAFHRELAGVCAGDRKENADSKDMI